MSEMAPKRKATSPKGNDPKKASKGKAKPAEEVEEAGEPIPSCSTSAGGGGGGRRPGGPPVPDVPRAWQAGDIVYHWSDTHDKALHGFVNRTLKTGTIEIKLFGFSSLYKITRAKIESTCFPTPRAVLLAKGKPGSTEESVIMRKTNVGEEAAKNYKLLKKKGDALGRAELNNGRAKKGVKSGASILPRSGQARTAPDPSGTLDDEDIANVPRFPPVPHHYLMPINDVQDDVEINDAENLDGAVDEDVLDPDAEDVPEAEAEVEVEAVPRFRRLNRKEKMELAQRTETILLNIAYECVDAAFRDKQRGIPASLQIMAPLVKDHLVQRLSQIENDDDVAMESTKLGAMFRNYEEFKINCRQLTRDLRLTVPASKFYCSYCKVQLSEDKTLRSHFDTHHWTDREGLECPAVGCAITLADYGKVKAHVKLKHKWTEAEVTAFDFKDLSWVPWNVMRQYKRKKDDPRPGEDGALVVPDN